MKNNTVSKLEEHLNDQIKRFSQFPDEYTAGRVDALIRTKLFLNELIESNYDFLEELVKLHSNDQILGKKIRKLINEKNKNS